MAEKPTSSKCSKCGRDTGPGSTRQFQDDGRRTVLAQTPLPGNPSGSGYKQDTRLPPGSETLAGSADVGRPDRPLLHASYTGASERWSNHYISARQGSLRGGKVARARGSRPAGGRSRWRHRRAGRFVPRLYGVREGRETRGSTEGPAGVHAPVPPELSPWASGWSARSTVRREPGPNSRNSRRRPPRESVRGLLPDDQRVVAAPVCSRHRKDVTGIVVPGRNLGPRDGRGAVWCEYGALHHG